MSETKPTKCREVAKDQPRAVIGEHYDYCDGAACEGCWPCRERHCLSCGREHTDTNCARCLAGAREDLTTIAHLCGFPLLEEALLQGVESEAAMLLGPAANTEAWNFRKMSAIMGRVDDAYLDDCRDEAHPLWTLGWIEAEWREAWGHTMPERQTIHEAADYISRMLHVVAGSILTPDGDQAPEFADAKTKLAACRSHLENVLSEGKRQEKGAPCPKCKRPLVKDYGKTEAFDRWLCPDRRGCGEWYTASEYAKYVTDDYRANADRLTAPDMAEEYGVPAGSVRGWATLRPGEEKPRVRKRGKDESGRQLYDVADVLAMRDGVSA